MVGMSTFSLGFSCTNAFGMWRHQGMKHELEGSRTCCLGCRLKHCRCTLHSAYTSSALGRSIPVKWEEAVIAPR